MKLLKFDLETRQWDEVGYPYPHTIAEVLFPNTKFAIVHIPRDMDAAEVLTALPKGWRPDFATGAKKHGDFVMTQSEMLAPCFWDTPEDAAGYGSLPLTTCYGFAPELFSFTVRVVENGEMNTDDCHGKASLTFLAKVGGDITLAGQFRLGFKEAGVLAKGTLVVDDAVAGLRLKDEGIDLVLPTSAFRSFCKPEPGVYTWDNTAFGIYQWAKTRRTKFSWQVVQWFSWETVEADLLDGVRLLAAQLLEAATDVRDAKIGDLGMAILVKEDVGRLQVAVDHAPLMCIVRSLAHLHCHLQRFADGQITTLPQPRFQRVASHVLHDDVVVAALPKHVMRAHNPFVGKPHRRLGLGQEALEHRLIAHQCRDQLLNGHLLAEQRILGQVGKAEPAPSELTDDAIMPI
jgi:hypothetical protein